MSMPNDLSVLYWSRASLHLKTSRWALVLSQILVLYSAIKMDGAASHSRAVGSTRHGRAILLPSSALHVWRILARCPFDRVQCLLSLLGRVFAEGDEEEVEGPLHGRCGEAAKLVQFQDIQTSTLQHVRIVSPFAAAHVGC